MEKEFNAKASIEEYQKQIKELTVKFLRALIHGDSLALYENTEEDPVMVLTPVYDKVNRTTYITVAMVDGGMGFVLKDFSYVQKIIHAHIFVVVKKNSEAGAQIAEAMSESKVLQYSEAKRVALTLEDIYDMLSVLEGRRELTQFVVMQ